MVQQKKTSSKTERNRLCERWGEKQEQKSTVQTFYITLQIKIE
jgi:hypothetical protein